MKIIKWITALGAAFLTACLIGIPVSADNGEVRTLSGHIEGDYTCSENVDKLILSGVQMDEGTLLSIETDTVLEIADGTENTVHFIQAAGMVDVTGGGTLQIGSGILAFGYDVMFEHTGEISITGSVAGIDANIILNSGTIHILTEAEDAAGISCLNGNVVMNGGVLNVTTNAVGISTRGDLVLNGGNVNVQSRDAALMAINDTGIQMSEELNPEGTSVTKMDNENAAFYVLTDTTSGEAVTSYNEQAPSSEQKKAESKEKFDKDTEDKKIARAEEENNVGESQEESQKGTEAETGESVDTKDSAETASDKQKIPAGLIIALVIIAIAAVAGVFVAKGNKGKDSKTKNSSNRRSRRK